jgi:hypothetical protein
MNVVQSSVTATYELTSELGLGPRDIPAWILFKRGDLEPLVVKTEGKEDIEDLLGFLKDLWNFDYQSISAPRTRATSRLQRLNRARQHMEDAGGQLDQMLERWREEEGSPSSRITRENAIDVIRIPVEESVQQRPGRNHAEPNRQPPTIDSHRLVKEIKGQWHKYQSAKESVCRLEKEISDYRDRINTAASVLEHNDREVERLAKRYQTRFKVRAVGAKLATFIRAATGVGKQTKDMTDILAKLRKAIGDDA